MRPALRTLGQKSPESERERETKSSETLTHNFDSFAVKESKPIEVSQT
jgi:hypothetical protein